MSFDFSTAHESFEGAIDGTIGLEEEFALLDPATLDLVPRFEELRDAAIGATRCWRARSPAS